MIEKNSIISDIEFAESNRMSIRKFYKDLNRAVKSNDAQSIWQLSKILTRFYLR